MSGLNVCRDEGNYCESYYAYNYEKSEHSIYITTF